MASACLVFALLCLVAGLSQPALAAGEVAFHADVTSGSVPLTVRFTVDAPESADSWQWDFGDGGSTMKNPLHTYNSDGTFTVRLTVSNGTNTWTEVKQAYIKVSSPTSTAPVAEFSANTTTGTAPLSVKFTSLASAGTLSCDWDFGDGTQHRADTVVVHVYELPGNYTVRFKASSPGGSDVKTAVIYVMPAPVPSPTPGPENASSASPNNTSAAIAASPSAIPVATVAAAPGVAGGDGLLTFSVSEDLLVIAMTAAIALVIAAVVLYYFSRLGKGAGKAGGKGPAGDTPQPRRLPAIGKKAPGPEKAPVARAPPGAPPSARESAGAVLPSRAVAPPSVARPASAAGSPEGQDAAKPPEVVKIAELLERAPAQGRAPRPPSGPGKGSGGKKEAPPAPPAKKSAKKPGDIDKDYLYGLVMGEEPEEKGGK